jgi:hypothetical protein
MRLREPAEALTEYTALPARTCDQKALAGELVIEYMHGDTRTATARSSRSVEPAFAPAAAFFAPAGTFRDEVLSADRTSRAIVGRWQAWSEETRERTGTSASVSGFAVGAPGSGGRQTLRVDVESLLPLTIELSVDSPVTPGAGASLPFTFRFDDAIRFGEPEVARPTCI